MKPDLIEIPQINDVVEIETTNGKVTATVVDWVVCYTNAAGFKLTVLKDGILSSGIDPCMVRIVKSNPKQEKNA